jgi:hypothetical protein
VIAVGIITAPRPRPTLAQSFESYEKAGFEGPTHIFAEPGSQDVPMATSVKVHRNPERLGNFRNWARALSQLLMVNEAWLMVCEDDIRWARGARDVLENDLYRWQRKDDDIGAISLYLPIRMSKVIETTYGVPLMRGWYPLNLGRKTWGAQCLVLRRTWAEMLLQDQVLLDLLADPSKDKNVDAHVAEALSRRGRSIMWRVPCLVDHAFGDGNSSLGYSPDRPQLKTKYFKETAR